MAKKPSAQITSDLDAIRDRIRLGHGDVGAALDRLGEVASRAEPAEAETERLRQAAETARDQARQAKDELAKLDEGDETFDHQGAVTLVENVVSTLDAALGSEQDDETGKEG